MNEKAKKVILHSQTGYNPKHDFLLEKLIDEKILLFCSAGKDCELWHDIMDELFAGVGVERDFDLITTWHTDERSPEVIRFAKEYTIEGIDNEQIRVIDI